MMLIGRLGEVALALPGLILTLQRMVARPGMHAARRLQL